MTAFLENIEAILKAAEQSQEPGDWTILTGVEGGVRMIAGSDWPLDSLRLHTGAEAAFRVHRNAGRVAVEGRTAHQSFGIQSVPMSEVARQLLR